MWKKYWFSLFIVATCLFQACSDKDSSPNISTDRFEYFPIHNFPNKIFFVEEIRYRTIDKPDTLAYFLREMLSDSLTLADGTSARRIQTFTAPSASGPWTADSTYAIWNKSGIAKTLGNNQEITRLVFPPVLNRTWIYLTIPGAQPITARLRGLGVRFNLGDTLLPNCLLASTFQDSSCVGKSLAFEVYAPNLGMIYSENTQLSYAEPCNPPNFIVLSGFKIRKYFLKGN